MAPKFNGHRCNLQKQYVIQAYQLGSELKGYLAS